MIHENIENINRYLSGLSHKVTLLCATKTIPYDVINRLHVCGITEIGENRVQEFLEKYDHVKGMHWHFIGRLQTNKVKYIVGKVNLIHSVDRISLAEEIDKQSKKNSVISDILLEVNIGGEQNKGGVSESCLDELFAKTSSLGNVRVRGLMTVMPMDADKKLYVKMKSLFDGFAAGNKHFDCLSMGMSSDYRIAAENGATLIRVGSAIFGDRI